MHVVGHTDQQKRRLKKRMLIFVGDATASCQHQEPSSVPLGWHHLTTAKVWPHGGSGQGLVRAMFFSI